MLQMTHTIRIVLGPLILTLTALLLLSGCDRLADQESQPLVLTEKSYDDLPNWNNDQHDKALRAMAISCERIVKKDSTQVFGPEPIFGSYADWQPPCQALLEAKAESFAGKPEAARIFFERWFKPYAARAGMFREGLFTGYYEPTLKGSRKKNPEYFYPLYKRPKDLIDINLGQFREDLKGRRIAGRIAGERLEPYADRRAIEAGGLPHGEPIVFVNSAIDAFFLHIQGSGQVKLDDGTTVRVGYAGQNGWPYYAVGRELVKRGELEKEQVSLQSIRDWMKSYPDDAADLRALNPSYIFFRELEGNRPLGGEGVPLTPKRSMAIDHRLWAYGVPIWLRADHPIYTDKEFYQLMIAQDTGGAIRGPIRGDVFWGDDDDAALLAGYMKSDGEIWALLPRTISSSYLSTARKKSTSD
mgnify:CR=1 FL=1